MINKSITRSDEWGVVKFGFMVKYSVNVFVCFRDTSSFGVCGCFCADGSVGDGEEKHFVLRRGASFIDGKAPHPHPSPGRRGNGLCNRNSAYIRHSERSEESIKHIWIS